MPDQPDYDVFQMLWKVIVALIIIIGLFMLIIKFLGQKNKLYRWKTPIRVIGGTALGQGKTLQIIEIAGTLYVVGVGEDVQLLDKIDHPEQIKNMMESLEPRKSVKVGETVFEKNPMAATSFREVFQDKLKSISRRNQEIQKWIEEDHEK